MYIPEFWTGVIATILTEFLFVTIMIIISTWRDKDNKNEDNNDPWDE